MNGDLAKYDYHLFGLRLRSTVPLPELHAVPPHAEPDVAINHGVMPAGMSEATGLRAVDGGVVIGIEGVARYAIVGGTRVIVAAAPRAAERNVRLYLLGSAMGMLLHQRGLLPLHANAVEIDGKAFAFMGPSGAGKSTLAAWFHDRGHRVIADDVCVVRFDCQGQAFAEAGLPRLRLCPDSLRQFGKDAANYRRSYVGDGTYEKYDVPVIQDQLGGGTPLAGIYLLGRGDALDFVAMDGVDAVEALVTNIYRASFASTTDSLRPHWQACVDLVREVPLFRLERRWSRTHFEDEARQFVAHARALALVSGGRA